MLICSKLLCEGKNRVRAGVFSAPIYHLSWGMLHLLKWNIICLCIELYLGWLLNENYYCIIAIRNGSAAYGCVQSIKWLKEPKTLQRPLQIHSMALPARFYTLISALEALGSIEPLLISLHTLFVPAETKNILSLNLFLMYCFLAKCVMQGEQLHCSRLMCQPKYIRLKTSQAAHLHQCPPEPASCKAIINNPSCTIWDIFHAFSFHAKWE